MTAAQLRAAEIAQQRAHGRYRGAQERRDALVRQAAREGWTHARIAEATGLTRSRVGQIALDRR